MFPALKLNSLQPRLRGNFGVVVASVGTLFCLSRFSLTNQMATTNVSVVYVTVPTDEVGSTLAKGLVEGKLAACVNILPQIKSVYAWEGKLNEDSEQLLMIKSKSSNIASIVDYVKANHPYSCPEVISVPVLNGNPEYLKWVLDSVK